MKYLLFVILFIYLTNWQAIVAFFNGSFFSKTKSFPYKNDWLFNFLKEKTEIEFKFKKAISDYYTAFSLFFPLGTIVFSSKVLEDFNKDEVEWISLHEAGHRVYIHGYKYIPISLIFIVFGIVILYHHNNPINNFFTIAFLLTPIYQQITRLFERQADTYAVKNMTNPKGMITANEKFAKASKSRIYRNDILRTLFTPHLSYEERIKMAEEEIKIRG